MQELLNELVTTALGLSLLGGSYLIWLLTGVANNLFNDKKWSWKRTAEDVAKTLLMAIAILGWVAVCYGVEWFAKMCNCDITALMDGASIAGVIGGILGGTIYHVAKAYKNILNFVNANHVEAKAENINYTEIATKVYDAFDTVKEAVERQKEFEKELEEKGDILEGGLGGVYNVPHDTYDHFRAAVMGNGYDIDGYYSYQCWDGSCLLWTQLGRWLQTGNGQARGCWKLKRDVNAGTEFELIYNLSDVQRGDVMFFDCGNYGHTGFADEDYNGSGSIRLLGQNQSKDMKFCVVNMSTKTFLGAMRFKQWKRVSPTPQPTPQPSKDKKVHYVYKKGDTFGQVICNLGLKTSHGLWGEPNGDVYYYTQQLHAQGIYGNIPIGTEIVLTPRK